MTALPPPMKEWPEYETNLFFVGRALGAASPRRFRGFGLFLFGRSLEGIDDLFRVGRGIGRGHLERFLFAVGGAGVALDALHPLDAPGSGVAVHGNGIGGAFLRAEVAEDALIHINGHMAAGGVGDLRGFYGIHEGSRLAKQASH